MISYILFLIDYIIIVRGVEWIRYDIWKTCTIVIIWYVVVVGLIDVDYFLIVGRLSITDVIVIAIAVLAYIVDITVCISISIALITITITI